MRFIRRPGPLLLAAGVLTLLLPAAVRAQAPDLARLRRTLDSIAAASGGRLGVGIELLETDTHVTRVTRVMLDSAGRFPMQSVYKLPIAMATLAAIDAGRLRLDQVVTISPTEFVTPGQYSPIRDRWPKGTTMPLREVLRF